MLLFISYNHENVIYNTHSEKYIISYYEMHILLLLKWVSLFMFFLTYSILASNPVFLLKGAIFHRLNHSVISRWLPLFRLPAGCLFHNFWHLSAEIRRICPKNISLSASVVFISSTKICIFQEKLVFFGLDSGKSS